MEAPSSSLVEILDLTEKAVVSYASVALLHGNAACSTRPNYLRSGRRKLVVERRAIGAKDSSLMKTANAGAWNFKNE